MKTYHRVLAFSLLLFETLLHGGWVLAMFCLPFLIAYGIELEANLLFFPIVMIGLAGYFVIAGCIGILLMIFIARWIISRPIRMLVGSIVFFVGFVSLFVYAAFANNVLTSGVTPTKLQETLANMRLSSLPYLPNTWMSELMESAHRQDWKRVALFLSLLVSTAWMMWNLAMELGSRWYTEGWLWTRERVGSKELLRDKQQYKTKTLWLMQLLPRRISSLVYKEVVLFIRDFSQWGQLVLILSITLFYILQTQNVMSGDTAARMKLIMACFNVLLLGFIQATLSIRYTYPSISLEGKQFWVVACAANGIERTFFMKYYLHTFFLLVLGLGLGTVLNRIVGVDSTLNTIILLVLFLFSFGFTSWSLGLGAIFNKFEATNIADVSSDTGTLVAMILTVLYLGISLSFMASFALMYTPGTTLSDIMALNQENGLMLYFTLFLLVQTCSILLPTAYGLKKLKEAIILR